MTPPLPVGAEFPLRRRQGVPLPREHSDRWGGLYRPSASMATPIC